MNCGAAKRIYNLLLNRQASLDRGDNYKLPATQTVLSFDIFQSVQYAVSFFLLPDRFRCFPELLKRL